MYEQFLGSRIEKFEYELLTFADNKYSTTDKLTTVKNGSINIDFSRPVIGTANVTMQKNNNINFHTDLLRIYYYLNNEYRYPVGTYFLTIPENKNSKTSYIENSIDCFDILLALEQDKLDESYVAEAGENIIELVEELITRTATWIAYDLVSCDEEIAENLCYEIGKSKLDVINSLLAMIGYYPLFANGYGKLIAKPWTSSYNIAWEFLDDENGLYLPDFNHLQDFSSIYNKAVVVTNSTTEDTEPLISSKTLEDINLDLPFSYSNINRYITRIFDSEAVSQTYVDLRAERELRKMAEVQETINYKHAFVSKRDDGFIQPGDCYKFRNTQNNINATYRIDKMNWNLQAGSLINTMLRGVINV